MGDARLRNDGLKIQVFPYLRASTKNYFFATIGYIGLVRSNLDLSKNFLKFSEIPYYFSAYPYGRTIGFHQKQIFEGPESTQFPK